MLSNIKTYHSEAPSQHSPSQNSPLCCTPGCLFTKGSLLILTSSYHACLHSHKILMALLTKWFGGPPKPTKWIKKKAVSWVWLVSSAS